MADVLIRQGRVWAEALGPDSALRALQDALTVDTPGAKYTKAYQWGRWDGKTKFFNRPQNRFLTGLTQRVLQVLDDNHISWELHEAPCISKAPLCEKLGVELRDYQHTPVKVAHTKKRLTIQCPTGSGKTEIGAEYARRVGGRILWIVNSISLLEQTYKRLTVGDKRLGPLLPGVPVGRIEGGTTDPALEDNSITLAMVQTLAKFDKTAPLWKLWDALIIDEAHHTGADTWFTIACNCTNALFRLGLSGTARSSKDLVRTLRLEGATGPIYVAAETQELTARGFLAQGRVIMLQPPKASFQTYEQTRDFVLPDWRDDPRRLGHLGGKLFGSMYDAGIVNNQARNSLFLNAIYKHVVAGEKVLALCNKIAHAHLLHDTWHARLSLRALVLDGGSPKKERQAVITQFAEAPAGVVLFATPFFREGLNIPEIDAFALIGGGGGESEVPIIQAVGRALRPRPDKTYVTLYDSEDGTGKHEKDYLYNHSMARLKIYRAQGFEVTTSRA